MAQIDPCVRCRERRNCRRRTWAGFRDGNRSRGGLDTTAVERPRSARDMAHIRNRETSDAAAHIFVVWPRWPAMLRARLIGYIWDASLPAGSIHKSQKT